MKKYIKSRIIMVIETIFLLLIFLLLKKETFVETSLSSATNENNTKVVSKEIIQKSQNKLFTEIS